MRGKSKLSNEIQRTDNQPSKHAILILTHLYPDARNSFLGTFVVEQICHLRSKYQVVVMTTRSTSLSDGLLHRSIHRLVKEVDVFAIPYQRFWLLWPTRISQRLFLSIAVFIDKLFTSRAACKLARRLHRQYHFSLVHGHEVLVGDEAVSVGRALGIPSVFTLHGLCSSHQVTFGKKTVDRAIANLNATDKLLAVSKIAAQSYQDKEVKRYFTIIPNGITQPEKISRTAIAPEIAAFKRGRVVFLTVGFFVPEKRIEMAIKTLGQLHRDGITNTVLLIIGRGPLEQSFRRMIREEKLSNAVKIIGAVPPQDMSKFYSITDILIHPSIVDSLSMVCLEAMSYAIPVICTSKIGLVEYVHQGHDAIVVPPDDLVSLYQAVLELVRNPSRRRAIGQRARNTANTLSWNMILPKIERVYEEVIETSE